MHIDKKDRKTVVINAIIIKNKGIIMQTNKQANTKNNYPYYT